MALIPPMFLDAVVALGRPVGGDGPKWVASGFMFALVGTREDETNWTGHAYLVTNRHVVEGEDEFVIRCNPQAMKPAKDYRLRLKDSDESPLWVGHPNGDVDVAVVPLNYKKLKDEGMQIYALTHDVNSLTQSQMKDLGLSEGDDVFVLGYPMGLVEGPRASVIVRGGTIARMQDALAEVAPHFLVDSTVFPGNSGGPVLLRPETIAITGTKPHPKSFLLGVASAYLPYREVAVSQQTGRPKVVFEENSGLVRVFTVNCIIETAEAHRASLTPAEESEDLDEGSESQGE